MEGACASACTSRALLFLSLITSSLHPELMLSVSRRSGSGSVLQWLCFLFCIFAVLYRFSSNRINTQYTSRDGFSIVIEVSVVRRFLFVWINLEMNLDSEWRRTKGLRRKDSCLMRQNWILASFQQVDESELKQPAQGQRQDLTFCKRPGQEKTRSDQNRIRKIETKILRAGTAASRKGWIKMPSTKKRVNIIYLQSNLKPQNGVQDSFWRLWL